MTREVNAVCQVAFQGGATKITVKDAHDTARNLDPAGLSEGVELIRGGARNPLIMMAGINESYDGVIFTGYHSGAGYSGNPLAHTMSGSYEYIKINGEMVSEFVINTLTAAYSYVPGDYDYRGQGGFVNEPKKNFHAYNGTGMKVRNSVISIHPTLLFLK